MDKKTLKYMPGLGMIDLQPQNVASDDSEIGSRDEDNEPKTFSAYDQKIYNAQFGGCAGCGSDERVKY